MSRGPSRATARSPLLIVALSVACDAGRPAARDPTVIRDSAGVTIVENTIAAPAGVPTWRVDTTPRVTIGVESGDPAYEFSQIGSVYGMHNGMILVLNGRGESAFEFRFFDSTGKHIATHGRLGQGPGDFRWVNFVASAGGDTVIAVDFPNSRLSWVSASAGYLRSSRLDEREFKRLLGDDASGVIETMVPLGDSLYAIKAFRRIPNAASPFERGNSFELVDLGNGRAFRAAQFDEPRAVRVQLTRGPITTRGSSDGVPAHVVDRRRRRICAARSSVTEVVCVDASGRRTRIRWRVDTVPYTAEDREQAEDLIRARFNSGDFVEGDADRIIAARDWPTHHPLFTVLQLDEDGNFWILEPFRGEDGERHERFRILDMDGRHIAFAEPFPVRNVGLGSRTHIGSRAVLRAYDAGDGVPLVGLFEIHK